MLDGYNVTALIADQNLDRAFAQNLPHQRTVMGWSSLAVHHIFRRSSGRSRRNVGAAQGGSTFLQSSEGPFRVAQGPSGSPDRLQTRESAILSFLAQADLIIEVVHKYPTPTLPR